MAVDIQDWSQAVQVVGGSVSISGIATVSVSGTVAISITGANTVVLGGGSASVGSISAIGSTVTVAGTVNIGNTPAVTISGTPTVNINSGSVSITGGTIQVTTAAGVQVAVAQAQLDLGSPQCAANGADVTTVVALPAGVQAIVLVPGGQLQTAYRHLKVVGHTSGAVYYERWSFTLAKDSIIDVFPVTGILEASLDVTVGGVAAVAIFVHVVGLLSSVPEFLEYYQPPWLFPNQLPGRPTGNIAAGNALIVTPAVANVTMYLHNFHMTALLPAGCAIPNFLLETTGGVFLADIGLQAGAGIYNFDFDFEGLPLPTGQGVRVTNATGQAVQIAGTTTYSLG